MPFWNTNRIKQECQAHGLITPYREDRAKRCAYELAVGNEAFITSKSGDTARLPEGVKVTIPPGQFCLLTTREVVFVPNNAIAFISMRAGIKFQGLVNVSGFHVDPGYRGKLKFAVYNAGSKNIVLDQDEQVFMIWYADLDAPTPDPYSPLPPLENVITAEEVRKIQGDVASPAELKKQIEELKVELKEKFHSCEQSRLFNRSILTFLLGVLGSLIVAILVWAFVKPVFDSARKTIDSDSQTTAGRATGPPAQPVSGADNSSAPHSATPVPSSTSDSNPTESDSDAKPNQPDDGKPNSSPTSEAK